MADNLDADEFDKLIMPAFEYLRARGERELALRLIAISADFDLGTREMQCLSPPVPNKGGRNGNV
jgi:hypothetical protein